VEKARSLPAEVFGDGIVGFRFGEGASDTSDTAADTSAKVDAPIAARKLTRTVKRRSAAATA
jgi:hypothetical protein